MDKPILPPVPDVIDFEDVPAQRCLQEWAEAYANRISAWRLQQMRDAISSVELT